MQGAAERSNADAAAGGAEQPAAKRQKLSRIPASLTIKYLEVQVGDKLPRLLQFLEVRLPESQFLPCDTAIWSGMNAA